MVKEQIRREKLKRLADLLGKVSIDEKAIHEGDKADMRRGFRGTFFSNKRQEKERQLGPGSKGH